MVIAVVLPEIHLHWDQGSKLFCQVHFSLQRSWETTSRIHRWVDPAAAFIAGNKFIYIQVSRFSVWDLGNLVHTSEKILKIIRNLHTINRHSTVCFMSLIVFLQFNSPFEFLDLFSCEQYFGCLSSCTVPVVLFRIIWKHSSFFFCTWDLSVVFSKASELIIFKFRTITAASQNSLWINFGCMFSFQTCMAYATL